MTRALRILSGLHTGAHINLTEGDWQLGSDPLCDILISDLAPQQGVLRIHSDGAVHFIPHVEQGQITQNTLAEMPIPEEGSSIPLYTCVTLGSIYIALGEESVPWPQISLPHEENISTENVQESLELSSAPKENTPAQASPAQKKEEPAQDSPLLLAAHPLKKSKKIILRLMLAGLLLTLTLGGIWTINSPSTEEKERQDIESVIEALLVDMSPAYLYGTAPFTIEKTKENTWYVCGAVEKAAIEEKLQLALQGLPFTVTSTIAVLSDAQQSLETHIKKQGSLLQVKISSNGLRLLGYIYDEKVLNDLLLPLQEEVQCLYLKKDVVFWEQLQNPITESLNALNLQSVVQMSPGSYGLTLAFKALSVEQQEKLKAFLQEVKDMTRGVSPFIKIAPISQIEPKMEDKNVSSGLKSLNEFCKKIIIEGSGSQLHILYDKKEFSRGAHLPNGLQVQEITDKYATFTLNERLLYCPR